MHSAVCCFRLIRVIWLESGQLRFLLGGSSVSHESDEGRLIFSASRNHPTEQRQKGGPGTRIIFRPRPPKGRTSAMGKEVPRTGTYLSQFDHTSMPVGFSVRIWEAPRSPADRTDDPAPLTELHDPIDQVSRSTEAARSRPTYWNKQAAHAFRTLSDHARPPRQSRRAVLSRTRREAPWGPLHRTDRLNGSRSDHCRSREPLELQRRYRLDPRAVCNGESDRLGERQQEHPVRSVSSKGSTGPHLGEESEGLLRKLDEGPRIDPHASSVLLLERFLRLPGRRGAHLVAASRQYVPGSSGNGVGGAAFRWERRGLHAPVRPHRHGGRPRGHQRRVD